MDKFLWIGGLVNPCRLGEYKRNGHSFMSSYLSQKNIIEGMEESCNIVFDTINSIRLNPFPRYKVFNIKKDTWDRGNQSKNVSVGYANIRYLSVFLRARKLVKESKKWAKRNKKNRVFVFCFGMTSPFMKASVAVSKIVGNCSLTMINPDLPQFMEKKPSLVKRFFKMIDYRWISKNIIRFKKQVLYSSCMADYLNLSKNEWILMEGSIDVKDCYSLKKHKSKHTIIMYTGVVGEMYGMRELINSLNYLNDDYELWVFGVGDYVNQLVSHAKKDKRIKYYGYCGDRKELLQKQKDSDILVSLINPKDNVSKYCFPSKLFEYLLSENIVISSKIDGIPDEYFNYLVPLNDVNAKSISEVIVAVSNFPNEKKELLGKTGKDFVLKKKNNLVQGKRIYDFVYGK